MTEAEMFTAAIVDDEKAQIDTLRNYLKRYFAEECSGEQLAVAEFRDGKELLDGYEPKYDVIFLDIEMNDVNGMATARAIRQKDARTVIIFVTRLANYAVKGYEVEAFDFIVKPVDYGRFCIKLKRALKHVEQNRERQIRIELPGGGLRWLTASQIRYAEIQNHSLTFHLEDETVRSWSSLKSVAAELENSGFAYCHRCYLVNLRYVTGIDKNTCMLGGEGLMISRYKKAEFVSALARFYGRGGGGGEKRPSGGHN